jgi:hypothetical protein
VLPEEWELTTDFRKAQLDYDLCLAPDAADGECFVKGEHLCFRRKTAYVKAPVYTADGVLVLEKWQWGAYTYYEAVPYPEYQEPLRGQGKTAVYHVEPSEDDPDYVRLRLVPGTGIPDLHHEERVCRLCEYAPSRGVFYKIDEDGIRYPIMVTPDTSEGYGVPTATLHHAYDETTYKCTDVVEHPSYKITRDRTELILHAGDECWRECSKIEGTIPPDLGDPRKRPKRIVYIEKQPEVTGSMPNLTALLSGTYLNMVTGQILEYTQYRSAAPLYPVSPDPAIMWNPGSLSRSGFDFLGFATYPNAVEPLFMLSGDTPTDTLFPVWQSSEYLAGQHGKTHTVTFTVSDEAGKMFFGRLPNPVTLKYGSEIDLMGYGDEEMFAYGFHFAGWSSYPIFQIPMPRIVITEDMTLYAVWYTARIPYNKPMQHEVSFGNGMKLLLNHSSVLRLTEFNPDHLSDSKYELTGWNVLPFAPESLFHLLVRSDVFLYPVWRKKIDPLFGPIYDPESPTNPFNDPAGNPYHAGHESSPYHEDNPYGVIAVGNPYDTTHDSYPYGPEPRVMEDTLFPSDPHHLYHPDNIFNPYHPVNPHRIVLVNGEVLNPDNPYSPASLSNPYHPHHPSGSLESPTHAYHPGNIENPYHPDYPYQPPITLPPVVADCTIHFVLTTRSAPRPYQAPKKPQQSPGVALQALNGWLKAPLEKGVFTLRQQFLPSNQDSYREDFRDKQTYCEDPHIPEHEKLVLTVSHGADGIFRVPTGGLSSSGASCLFDWDIWIDYRYTGRYTGNSGLRSAGISLELKPEPSLIAPGIQAAPRYTRMSREKEIELFIEVKSSGQWECLPFWVMFSDGGVFRDKGTGIAKQFLTADGLKNINSGNTMLTVTKKPGADLQDRLLQGFVFYPKRKVNGCAVELVLLDLCHPYHDAEPLHLNRQTVRVQYPCENPFFTLGSSPVQVYLDSSLTDRAMCVLNTALEEVVTNTLEPPQPEPSLPEPSSPEPPLKPVLLGVRAGIKDAEAACSHFFTLTASPVKRKSLPDSLTGWAREKRKCIPYEPKPGVSKIIIRPHYKSALRQGWLRAFGFHPESVEEWNSPKNKEQVAAVSAAITPMMFCDSAIDAGNYCMRYLFYGCRSLKLESPFTFTEDWNGVHTAGNDFMFKMFQDCTSLDQFPVDYREPQGFITVGENFKAYKCCGCLNLQNIGLADTEPPHLFCAGYSFEAFEYADCKSLLVLPEGYRETAEIRGDKLYDFQLGQFFGCVRLRTLPDRYTESRVLSVGHNYLAYKFCESGLEFLPQGYSESLALTFIGKNCQAGKFKGCVKLLGLPDSYTEINPGNIEDNFVKHKFKDSLQLVVNINYKFPNVGTAVHKPGVFEETFAAAGGAEQRVSAHAVLNGNQVPAQPKKTFGDNFTDYTTLAAEWKQ